MRKSVLPILSLIILILTGACSKDNDELSLPPDDANKPELSEWQEELLRLVNETRAEGCDCGNTEMPPVAPLTWDKKLENAAQKHTQDMYDNNYMDHYSQDGRSPGDRITAEGYRWRTYGENIARGYPTPEQVMNGWLGSTGHCKNIMNGNFKEIGLGKSGSYWTQVFATPL